MYKFYWNSHVASAAAGGGAPAKSRGDQRGGGGPSSPAAATSAAVSSKERSRREAFAASSSAALGEPAETTNGSCAEKSSETTAAAPELPDRNRAGISVKVRDSGKPAAPAGTGGLASSGHRVLLKLRRMSGGHGRAARPKSISDAREVEEAVAAAEAEARARTRSKMRSSRSMNYFGNGTSCHKTWNERTLTRMQHDYVNVYDGDEFDIDLEPVVIAPLASSPSKTRSKSDGKHLLLSMIGANVGGRKKTETVGPCARRLARSKSCERTPARARVAAASASLAASVQHNLARLKRPSTGNRTENACSDGINACDVSSAYLSATLPHPSLQYPPARGAGAFDCQVMTPHVPVVRRALPFQ